MAIPIRSFIAAHLSQTVQEQIALFQSGLKKIDADVKWIRPENIHITLKFLGDITHNQIEPIAKIMADIAKPENPFKINIQGVGCFPNERRPRVLWLGIQTENNALLNMANALNLKLETLDFQREQRAFKPHLTLGRVKSLNNIDTVINQMNHEGFKSRSILMDHIYLMQSVLKPSGAEYSILEKIQL